MRWCSIETRDRIILEKIISYCQRIADNLSRYNYDFASFQNDHLFQDACYMCVVQIGELVTQLSEETKKQYTAVPWRIIKDTRLIKKCSAIDRALCHQTEGPIFLWKHNALYRKNTPSTPSPPAP